MRVGDGELAIGVGLRLTSTVKSKPANEAFLEVVADGSFENMPAGVALPIGKLPRANVFQASMSNTSSRRHTGQRQGWNMPKAALNDSSHFALPAFLRWFTANIGVRHVHHLSSSDFRDSLQGNDHSCCASRLVGVCFSHAGGAVNRRRSKKSRRQRFAAGPDPVRRRMRLMLARLPFRE